MLQRGEQRFGAHRLRQVLDASGFPRRLSRIAERAGRHRDHRNALRRFVGGQPARRREAVEVGHLHVHEDDVGMMLARERDAFEPAGRGDHLQAGALEQAREDAAAHGAVVDDQRGHLLSRREPREERRLRPSAASLRRVVVGGNQRQREMEAAALAERAVDVQIGAHDLAAGGG